MEAIRKIVNANVLAEFIDLPWQTKDMQIEMILMPVDEPEEKPASTGESLKGCLKEYANPALWEKENSAWADSVVEKYAAL